MQRTVRQILSDAPATIPNTCFLVAPFDDRFDKMYALLEEAMGQLGICTERANARPHLGFIPVEILSRIASSEFVVVDVSGGNANVLYELGVAHAVNDRVIIISEAPLQLPFNLAGFPVITYSVKTDAQSRGFKVAIRETIESLRQGSVPSLIEGHEERTRFLVNFMRQEVAAGRLQRGYLRTQGRSLGSFAIPQDERRYKESSEVGDLLAAEGSVFREIAQTGCRIRALIQPLDTLDEHRTSGGDSRRHRVGQLVEFLEALPAGGAVQFAFATVRTTNKIIVNEKVVIEGFRPQPGLGLEVSLIMRDPTSVSAQIYLFDLLFEKSLEQTVQHLFGRATASTSEIHRAMAQRLRSLLV